MEPLSATFALFLRVIAFDSYWYLDSLINAMRYSIHKKDGIIKEGLTAIDQLSGDDMMSPLYTDDETVDMPITINLQSYLYISEEGFYAFRIRSNNPDSSVRSIPSILLFHQTFFRISRHYL